jgi:hypothetical protein
METDLHKSLILSISTKINTLLYADDQVILADSEDNLQDNSCVLEFTLRNTAEQFGVEISPEISETIAFFFFFPVRCKILVGNKCLQTGKSFKYRL